MKSKRSSIETSSTENTIAEHIHSNEKKTTPKIKHTPHRSEQTAIHQNIKLGGDRRKILVQAKSLYLRSDCVTVGEGFRKESNDRVLTEGNINLELPQNQPPSPNR
ncbi:hypothetical protein QL285_063361 [Trifolium repens]|nr:hypothetical protein QL285_063361 [Trifolium repens]